MGHIELSVPVSHIWFFKCMPSRIGLVLDMTARNLERVIYYEDYLVIDPGQHAAQAESVAQRTRVPGSARDLRAPKRLWPRWVRKACARRWQMCNLAKQVEQLQEGDDCETKSKQIRKKLAKRIKLLRASWPRARSRPEWMILTVLPVIPPDLRPLVPLEGGRFATS